MSPLPSPCRFNPAEPILCNGRLNMIGKAVPICMMMRLFVIM